MMRIIPTKKQWIGWSMPAKAGYLGMWFGGIGLLISLIAVLITIIQEDRIPDLSPEVDEVSMAFENLLYRVDEEIKGTYDNWLNDSLNPLWCEEGSRIGTLALILAEQIDEIDDSLLNIIRPTKTMAKYEYLVMLYSFATAIADNCPSSSIALTYGLRHLAGKALENQYIVEKLGYELYIEHTSDRQLLMISRSIIGISFWYTARVKCILCLRFSYECEAAVVFAKKAHDLFPEEYINDPWIDSVRNIDPDFYKNIETR